MIEGFGGGSTGGGEFAEGGVFVVGGDGAVRGDVLGDAAVGVVGRVPEVGGRRSEVGGRLLRQPPGGFATGLGPRCRSYQG